MEINELEIGTATSTDLPWGEQIIMPLGDIQYGAEGVMMKQFRRDVEWGIEHGAYFIGMGDYVDVASPSNREKIKAAGFYDSVTAALEDSAERHFDEFMHAIRGTEGRWLGLHEGHHFWEFNDGTTTDTRLAQALGAPFLGTCALSRIRMKQSNGRSLTMDIWSHHGSGSGVLLTSPLNKLEKISGSFDADLFLINHFQRKGAVPKDWLYVDRRGQLKHKMKYLVATGGYMRGYTQGSKQGRVARGSYVERGMLSPANLGGVKIFLTPNRKGSRSNHIQIEVMV